MKERQEYWGYSPKLVQSRPELIKATTPKLTKYITHKPTEKQTAFLLLSHREVFFGGAGGGGKSDALLMAALQYVDLPGYAALLLMRAYSDLSLPKALMTRAHEWLGGTDARWDGQEKTWYFPTGATVTFGYLEHENDKYRYKSAEFQYVGFDELTQFAESQYQYMFTRLRRLKGVEIPLRVRSASNPDGPGFEWVKQRFIIEARKFGRIFIPARLEDNPHIDQEEYDESLKNLDPITRQRIREGDWSVRPSGNKFKRHWFKIVDTAPVDMRIVRYWDLASTAPKKGKDPDWTRGAKVGMTYDGRYYILDIQGLRDTPGEVEKLIKQTAILDELAVDIWMEQEPGSSGVNTIDHYTRTVLRGFAFRGFKTTGSKELRANPVSSQAEAGNVYLLRGDWINEFLDEIVTFPQGSHDDQVDAVSGAFLVLSEFEGYESWSEPQGEEMFLLDG